MSSNENKNIYIQKKFDDLPDWISYSKTKYIKKQYIEKKLLQSYITDYYYIKPQLPQN